MSLGRQWSGGPGRERREGRQENEEAGEKEEQKKNGEWGRWRVIKGRGYLSDRKEIRNCEPSASYRPSRRKDWGQGWRRTVPRSNNGAQCVRCSRCR